MAQCFRLGGGVAHPLIGRYTKRRNSRVDVTILKDFIVAGCAIGGFVLGIVNFRKNLSDDAVKLKLKPLSFHSMGNGKDYGSTENGIDSEKEFITIGVKVINLSKFDVTITETGLQLKEGNRRIYFPEAVVLGGDSGVPLKLPSRESITISFKPNQLPDESIRSSIESIYVHTACELEFFGSGKVIEDFSYNKAFKSDS